MSWGRTKALLSSSTRASSHGASARMGPLDRRRTSCVATVYSTMQLCSVTQLFRWLMLVVFRRSCAKSNSCSCPGMRHSLTATCCIKLWSNPLADTRPLRFIAVCTTDTAPQVGDIQNTQTQKFKRLFIGTSHHRCRL
ncbi:ORF2R [Turbot reddish body iridovirus]|uniref:ORF2R n=1 Tax=Turbot reddish body iridovirus TaxID=273651 RepID=E2CTU7_ISKNV|nr:ORF2R [Turbot reddish body iridovirus]